MPELWLTKQPITARYGWRDLPGVGRNNHEGVDFALGKGVAVSACGAGTVTEAGTHRVYGKYVKIDHGGGVSTSYHSLDSIAVKVGQTVKQQQTVGGAGSSAMGATGPHLHLGLWIKGEHVDPLAHLVQGECRTVGGNPPGSAPNQASIQVALAARGYSVVVDGKYGAQSQAAARSFQRAVGIKQDAQIGPVTWARLRIVEDSKLGPQTIRGVQALLGAVVDGHAGTQTDSATQKAWGFKLSTATPAQILRAQRACNAGAK